MKVCLGAAVPVPSISDLSPPRRKVAGADSMSRQIPVDTRPETVSITTRERSMNDEYK